MIKALLLLVALLIAVTIVWAVIEALRSYRLYKSPASTPQVTWGVCWACSRLLNDGLEFAKLCPGNYAPLCSSCASKPEYKRYVVRRSK